MPANIMILTIIILIPLIVIAAILYFLTFFFWTSGNPWMAVPISIISLVSGIVIFVAVKTYSGRRAGEQAGAKK